MEKKKQHALMINILSHLKDLMHFCYPIQLVSDYYLLTSHSDKGKLY